MTLDIPSIAVVCGGPSAEAEVSRSSGRCVAEALSATFSSVEVMELDAEIADRLRDNRPDIVFPVLHGPPGEDGSFQGLLEILGIPYVGSGVRASACAMDKIVAKQIFRGAHLPVAREVVVARYEELTAAVKHVLATLGSNVVIKPSSQGSALGVLFANNERTLTDAILQARVFDDQVLVEQRISGREVTVAILERDGVEALPAVEVRTPADSWYDFEHRYTAGLSEHVIPAPLTDDQYQRVLEVAIGAHRALGCRDLSRADFVVPEYGQPVLLEVNTLPGMTPTSLYPDAARAAGITFEELVAHLARRAFERTKRLPSPGEDADLSQGER